MLRFLVFGWNLGIERRRRYECMDEKRLEESSTAFERKRTGERRAFQERGKKEKKKNKLARLSRRRNRR